MKLKVTAAALVAALVLPLHAIAGVTITALGPGGVPLPSLPPAFTNIATFDSIAQTPYGYTTPTGPFTNGGGSWSGTGIVMNNQGGGSLGLYAEPYNDTTNYMAVLGGSSETVTYNHTYSELGLYWGSIDSYNVLTLVNTLTSQSAIVPVPPVDDGGQTSADSNRYFIVSGFAFNEAVFGSNINSFEFDNVAVAAPEPSTWAMMLVGFAGFGFVTFRQSRMNRSASDVA